MRKAFLFFFLAVFPLVAGELPWKEDLSSVKNEARTEKKPIFMLFTGSDWCSWCKKLEGKILNKDGFSDKLKDKFVFMKVDFPLNSPQSPETKRQNVKLRQEFSVQGFPTIIILDSDFYPIQVLGYQDISPEDFAGIVEENVSKYNETMKQMNAVFDQNGSSSVSPDKLETLYQQIREFRRPDLKEKIIDLGLEQGDNSFFLLEKYQLLAEQNKLETFEGQQIKEKIMKNQEESRLGSLFRMTLIEFQDKLDHSGGKPEGMVDSVKPLKEYANNFGAEDRENGWRVNLMISQILSSVDNHQEALEYAKNAERIAPENMKAEIEETIRSIQNSMQER